MKARVSASARRAALEEALCASIAQHFGSAITLLNAAFAERLGMNPTDFKCVAILLQTGAIPAGRLGELAQLSTAATTLVVDRLERAGLVRRERDADDRRRVILRPVPNAKLEGGLAKYQAELVRSMMAVTAGYNERDLKMMRDFIDRASEVLRGMAHDIHAHT